MDIKSRALRAAMMVLAVGVVFQEQAEARDHEFAAF